jgi:mannosyltransferase
MKKLFKNPLLYVILAGFFIRLTSLGQSFWLDEATSATVAQQFSFTDILQKFSPGDFHPPLYYLFIRLWSYLFPVNEVFLRLPSVLFGVLSIYVIYLIGKLIHSQKTGLIAAILLAVAPLHIYYSQEARMYSLTLLLVFVSVYFFLKVLKKESRNGWVLFSLSLPLILLTDYPALLILPCFWLYALLVKKSKAWWKSFLLSHLLLILVFVLLSGLFTEQLKAGLSVNTTMPGWWKVLGQANLKEILLIPTKFILGRIGFDNKIVYAGIIALSGLSYGYLIWRGRKIVIKNYFLLIWLFLPIALAALISFKISIFSYFRLIFVLPAMYLILALGLTSFKKKTLSFLLPIVVLVNLLFASIYLFNPKFQREDWRGLTDFILKEKGEGKPVVIFVANSQMEALKYYAKDTIDIQAGTANLKKDTNELYLMRYVWDVFDPEDKVRLKVEKAGFLKTAEYDFNKVVVWKYFKVNF